MWSDVSGGRMSTFRVRLTFRVILLSAQPADQEDVGGVGGAGTSPHGAWFRRQPTPSDRGPGIALTGEPAVTTTRGPCCSTGDREAVASRGPAPLPAHALRKAHASSIPAVRGAAKDLNTRAGIRRPSRRRISLLPRIPPALRLPVRRPPESLLPLAMAPCRSRSSASRRSVPSGRKAMGTALARPARLPRRIPTGLSGA